jgi:hypothetical protein
VKEESSIYVFIMGFAPIVAMMDLIVPRWSGFVSKNQKIHFTSLGAKFVLIVA